MNMKRIFNLGMALTLLVTSFAVSQPVAAEAPMKFTPRIAQGADVVPGEVVVAFADSGDKTLVEKIEQAVETADTADGEVTRLNLDGSAVIRVDGDTSSALAELNSQPDVLYAEPNYVYSAPVSQASLEEYKATSEYVFRSVTPSVSTNWKSVMAVPNSTIQSMVAMGTYPTDTYLTSNQAWFNMGADIVWTNTTASAYVCEIDTGVDTSHPDMTTKTVTKTRKKTITSTVSNIISGYDFVNADTIPEDDNGHGTHVAGIMVASRNNSVGIAGISTGKVVAVKALDAQGMGTNFDVAAAIQYCANRTDIRVINLSLGGPAPSAAIKDALLYATTPTTDLVPSGAFIGLFGKGKLVVVAAGNDNTETETYPAAYSIDPAFPGNRILSVGATGKDISGDIDYTCKANTSNFGDWVTVTAPGYDIYSTTPYDKPFYQNYYGHLNTRYDYLSGTSMAAAFVSASAARRMGYKPLETASQVGALIVSSGDPMDTTCTPLKMQDKKRVNVATLLDRTGIRVSVFDAAAGVPLNGAVISANFTYNGIVSSRTGTIAPQAYKDLLGDVDPNRIFTYYASVTDILDIPTKNNDGSPITALVPTNPPYTLTVNKSGYTNGYQPAFQQESVTSLVPGSFNVYTNAAVPPLSADFNVVLGWHEWKQYAQEATSYDDLDLYVWLPGPTFPDPGQFNKFIVGFSGDAFGDLENDSYGAMTVFPFARLKREGGFLDGGPTIESTSIARRAAHSGPTGSVLANAALPFYAGAYSIYATDYGQTIDHDNDGCGDNYGFDFDPDYVPGAECTGNTAGIPLLGAYYTPYLYVWKDGVVKTFVNGSNNFGPWAAGSACNKSWWKALLITSPVSATVPTYTIVNTCDDGSTPDFHPYPPTSSGVPSRINTFPFGNK